MNEMMMMEDAMFAAAGSATNLRPYVPADFTSSPNTSTSVRDNLLELLRHADLVAASAKFIGNPLPHARILTADTKEDNIINSNTSKRLQALYIKLRTAFSTVSQAKESKKYFGEGRDNIKKLKGLAGFHGLRPTTNVDELKDHPEAAALLALLHPLADHGYAIALDKAGLSVRARHLSLVLAIVLATPRLAVVIVDPRREPVLLGDVEDPRNIVVGLLRTHTDPSWAALVPTFHHPAATAKAPALPKRMPASSKARLPRVPPVDFSEPAKNADSESVRGREDLAELFTETFILAWFVTACFRSYATVTDHCSNCAVV